MKTKVVIGSIIALAALVACNKEAEIEQNQDVYEYTFVIKDGSHDFEETRSFLDKDETGLYLKWENGDKLTTITHSTNSGNAGYSYSQNSKVVVPANASDPVTFTISSYKPLKKDDMVYCASPYIGNPGTDPTKVTLSIPDSQKQDSGSFDGDALPMVAVPFPISAAITQQNGTSSESEAVSFYALGSVVEFDVFSPTNLYSGETVSSITFTTSDSDYIAGSFNFDLTGVVANDSDKLSISGYTGKSITVDLNAAVEVTQSHVDKDNAAKVYMVVAPGTHSGTLEVVTNVAKYSYTIPSREFKRASIRRFGVNLEKTGAREQPSFYRLVTEQNDDYSGTYLVVYNGKAMNGSEVDADNNTTTSVMVSDNKIEETESTKSLEVTVTADGDHYTLRDKNGKYIYMSSTTSSIGITSEKKNVDFEFSDDQLKCKTLGGVYLKNKDGNKTKFYTGNNPLVSFYLLDGTGVSVTKVADPDIVCSDNTVTITCSTKNAVIYYTTDGSIPSSTNGNEYTEPFAINQTTIVKAIATKSGLDDSNVVEETCTFVELEHNLSVSGEALTEESGVYTLSLDNLKDSEATIAVTSNHEWEVVETSNTGYTITSTIGTTGNGSITIKANASNENQTVANLGTIKVREKSGSLYKDILIKQAAKGSAPAAGTILWKDTFVSANSQTNDFTKAPAVSTYDYAGRSGYGTNATSVTLTADSNVALSSSTASGVEGGHLWFNKQKKGVLTTSAISVFSATNLTFSFTKAKGSVKVEYSIDNSQWTTLGTFTTNASTASYNFSVPNGTTSVYLRLTEANVNAALRVDNLTLSVAE